jgi:hypothetical protein
MSAALRVRLKIADLTASTAVDAGRKLLPPGLELSRMAREELYLFEPAPRYGAQAFERPLLRAIESSNFFVNPNKEQYRFVTTGEGGAALEPPEGSWGILARPRDGTRDDGLKERLLREHPLEGLGTIRRARLWWLWTRGPGGGISVSECYRVLGRVTGAREGLLVNPHAEADLLIERAIPWTEVETFLRASEPPARDAA